MGMYTELHFNSGLKKDVPNNVITTLEYMLGEIPSFSYDECPEHELFNSSRWPLMLRMDSAYFDADTHSTLRYSESSDRYYLCTQSNLKNYDNEIEKFIDWITPYLDKYEGDFLGFTRYEESEEPTLLRYRDTSMKEPMREFLVQGAIYKEGMNEALQTIAIASETPKKAVENVISLKENDFRVVSLWEEVPLPRVEAVNVVI